MSTEKKEKSTFWKDFKKFIAKGNVIDMAVGVVIGGSFGKIVTGLVNYIINPFVGLFIKSGSLDTVKTIITPAELAEDGVTIVTPEVAILWGTWFQTIIDFIITAFCIFVVLRIIMKAKNNLNEKTIAEEKAKADAAAKKAAEEKKIADEAAAVAAKAAAERQLLLEESVLHQEKLLAEMCEQLKKSNRS